MRTSPTARRPGPPGRAKGRAGRAMVPVLVAALAAGGVTACGGSGQAPGGAVRTPATATASSVPSSPTAPTTAGTSPAVGGEAMAWANRFCAALAGWEASMRVQVSRPEPTPSVAGQSLAERLRGEVRARLNGVAEATDQLLSDLRATGVPTTGAGTAVERELTHLAAQLEADVSHLRAMATAPVGGIDQLRAQAAEVHDVVTGALTEVQQSIDRIKALDPGGELSSALASAPMCRILRSGMASGAPSSTSSGTSSGTPSG